MSSEVRERRISVPVPIHPRCVRDASVSHGRQQAAKQLVVDSKFPGADKLGADFTVEEEWYSLKNFAPDLHVVLVMETAGMDGRDYQRPRYPATWARKHNEGRVFYTSMGHREDVWTRPEFQNLVVGGITWAVGDVKADTTPNIDRLAARGVRFELVT